MSNDTLLGRQLDEYRLEALLGQGGMARVYRGFDVRLKRAVAIKVIDKPFRRDTDYIARFEREAQAIARLNHPYIVKMYRYGQAGELLYIAMEYINGTNLKATLATYEEKGVFIPLNEASRIIRQVCQALDHAHSQGVIHRDIKPSNIMLNNEGLAILTDFGLALQTAHGTQGKVFGTPNYMAPEQVISSARAVPQSDLYAVGVILYQMFTNRLPFEAGHPDDVARMHLLEPLPPPGTIKPDLSPDLEAVVLKALAKAPEDRYLTGAALAKAIDQALQSASDKLSTPSFANEHRAPLNISQEDVMLHEEHIKRLIVNHNRRLAMLNERVVKQGLAVDSKIPIEIEDIEAEIERLEAELEKLKLEPVNEELGQYRLATRLGQGGMADVYRAYDSKLTRFVAIKVLHRHLSQDEAFVERFYNEATTVANLKHPNIVEIYDFGVERGKYYMVMVLIDGDTLEAKLRRRRAKNRSFDLTETLRIVEVLAVAIDYAHAEGVVHHDLNPSNIMFTEDQRIMLTDFGIARLVGTARQTATGAILGTPAYMSPEQARGERGDTRSDIYSLGVILYEMVTGNEPTPLLISDNSGLSSALKEVILKALSKNPNDRYQTAGALAQALMKSVEKSRLQPGEGYKEELPQFQLRPPVEVEIIKRFNDGCEAYQQALVAQKNDNSSEYEAKLRHTVILVVGAMEWALKDYLEHACRGTKDYSKIKYLKFYELIELMGKYTNPSLSLEMKNHLNRYRSMRNATEHEKVIPPRERVDDAIKTIRQFLLTYFAVEEGTLKMDCSAPDIDQHQAPKLGFNLRALQEHTGSPQVLASHYSSPSVSSDRVDLSQLDSPDDGTMRPDSPFYVIRPSDKKVQEEIKRDEGVTISIKGPRQVGKSSMLMRVAARALGLNKLVVILDFQQFDKRDLADADTFFQLFCSSLSDELGLEDRVDEFWHQTRGNSRRCTRFMSHYILEELNRPLLLALDEVDTIFNTDFGDDFFGMLRSWHNSRGRPNQPIWKNLYLALVTSTEPYLFIKSRHQSPFNVGTTITLTDFTPDQVSDLNRRHGFPFTSEQEKQLIALVGGHPYLVRKALYEVAGGQLTPYHLFSKATDDLGPFGAHLHHHFKNLQEQPKLKLALKQLIHSRTYPDEPTFFRLQGAGLVARDGGVVRPRCQLYADYFRERLND